MLRKKNIAKALVQVYAGPSQLGSGNKSVCVAQASQLVAITKLHDPLVPHSSENRQSALLGMPGVTSSRGIGICTMLLSIIRIAEGGSTRSTLPSMKNLTFPFRRVIWLLLHLLC